MQVGTFNLAIMLKMWLKLPWRIEFLQIYNSIIKDDKSTWTKIESTSSDMVTRFVSIKGEKTDAKDGFRDLPVIMMVTMMMIVMVTQHEGREDAKGVFRNFMLRRKTKL